MQRKKYKLIDWCPTITNLKDFRLNKKILYQVNYPDNFWHKKNKFVPIKNYSIDKKDDFINKLKIKFVLTPTDNDANFSFKSFSYKKSDTTYFHIGSNLKLKRLNQIVKSYRLLKFLISYRKNFDVVLAYNIDIPYFFNLILLKIIFKKKIYLQLEDNYVEKNIPSLKKYIYLFFYKFADLVISPNLINRKYFQPGKHILYNGFSEYTRPKKKLQSSNKFIFGGTLDQLRGAHLLPEILKLLEEKYVDFELHITGVKPNQLNLPTHQKLFIHGFLDIERYQVLLEQMDYGLILQQKEDGASGFFPSKTLDYYKKGLIIKELLVENR